MRVTVSYCLPTQQTLVELVVPKGCTARAALEQSGLLSVLGVTEIESLKVGVFSQKCTLDTELRANDRLEIYRDLLLSPTEARKLRAKAQKLNSPASGTG